MGFRHRAVEDLEVGRRNGFGVRMKILVTGHLGYIGTLLVPMLLKKGHDVVGLRRRLVQPLHVRRPAADRGRPEHPQGHSPGHRRGPARLRHGHAPGRTVERSAGELRPELHRRHQPQSRRATSAKSPSRRACGTSFSARRARTTAWRERFIDENGTFNPYTPYAKAKVAAEQDLKPLSTENFSVDADAHATAFGYSPRIRWDLVLNNLTAHAVTTGKILHEVRRHAVARRSSTSRTSAARSPRSPKRSASSCTTEAFNVGQTKENYHVSDIARDRRRDGAELPHRIRPRRRPDRAATA